MKTHTSPTLIDFESVPECTPKGSETTWIFLADTIIVTQLLLMANTDKMMIYHFCISKKRFFSTFVETCVDLLT